MKIIARQLSITLGSVEILSIEAALCIAKGVTGNEVQYIL